MATVYPYCFDGAKRSRHSRLLAVLLLGELVKRNQAHDAGRGLEVIVLGWDLLNRVSRSLKAVHGLVGRPFEHALGVIAVGENVVAGRKTMRPTLRLHFVQLFPIELRFFESSPVMRAV